MVVKTSRQRAERARIVARSLPEGWTSEERGSFTVVTMQNLFAGSVTIDWQARGFRLGFLMTGPMDSQSKYVGRNWQQHLLADTVARLQSVWSASPSV